MLRKLFSFLLIGLVFFTSAKFSAASAAVVINEFLPKPAPSDDQDPNEWIELFNSDSSPVNLSGWKIDDGVDGSNPYIMSSETIPANGFLILEKSTTGLSLSNDSDSVRLFNSTSVDPVDSFSYSNPPDDKSYGRSSDGGGTWTVCGTQSKNASNNGNCPVSTVTPTPTVTPSPTQPAATSTPTNTPVPAPTRTPTPTLQRSPTPRSSLTPTPTPTEDMDEERTVPGVSPSPTPTPAGDGGGSNSFLPLAIMLACIGGGLGLITFLLVWKKRNAHKQIANQTDLP